MINTRKAIRSKHKKHTMMIRSRVKSFRRDREGINDAVLYNCLLGGAFHLAMSRFLDLTR